MVRSLELSATNRSNTKAKGIGFLVAAVVLVNFISETAHGILTHELGTEYYAPFSTGEVSKGLLLVLMVGYALVNVRYRWSRFALAVLSGMSLLVAFQGLLFGSDLRELGVVFGYGLRAMYFFFVFSFIALQLERRSIAPQKFLGWLKSIVFFFYCIPILLAALGIAGYARPDRDFGFLGFVMNNNVVSLVLVCLSPFFLKCKSVKDYVVLLVYLGASVLLAARAAYFGIGMAFFIVAGRACLRFVSRLLKRRSLRVHKRMLMKLAIVLLIVWGAGWIVLSTSLADRLTGIIAGLTYMGRTAGEGTQAVLAGLVSTGRREGAERFLAWAANPDNWHVLLIGGGVTTINLRTELDWVDLTVTFGIGMTFMLYGTILYLLWRVYAQRNLAYRFEIFLSLVLVVAVSLGAGHTFTEPASSTVIGCVIAAFLSQTDIAARGKMHGESDQH